MPDVFLTGFLGTFGDAIDFIFTPQTTRFQTEKVGGIDQVLELGGEHVKVTFLALGAAILIALPAGVLLGHYRRGEMVALTLGNAGRGIPELAVIALAAAFLGFGLENVVAALMILGIPPILTNAYVGVAQVDRTAVEAARGVGMRDLEVIGKVELPLAVPTIMSGVRTGAINIVATAAIAPLAGTLTLGDFIISRNVYGDAGVLAGAILIALLAIAIELGLAGLQYLLTPRGLKLSRSLSAA
ncbi:MAG TPA: ABC transporter permease [Solirubrobacterales bacterium]|jgi:osmoprotectant transport system permease protein|nr:ABC transporter permease [Solirubrobacterales bacterium]